MVPEPRSAYAFQFFVLASFLLTVAIGLSFVLLGIWPPDPTALPNQFSIAFGVSTCMLFIGSLYMQRAVGFVRRERQSQFRQSLMLALIAGTVFVAVQTFALTTLIRRQPADEAATGAAVFAAVFATLHGMHFIVALLFLSYVAVQARADRYDHEYFWGVTICAWFWHFLGIAWTAILTVILIAGLYGDSSTVPG